MQKIIVTFDEAGNPEVKTEGFAGSGCSAATKDLEAALGVVKSDVKTRDYYAAATNAASAKAGGAK